jgi:hypothetical protein
MEATIEKIDLATLSWAIPASWSKNHRKILNHAPVGVTDQVCALYDYEREKREALELLAMHLEDLGL